MEKPKVVTAPENKAGAESKTVVKTASSKSQGLTQREAVFIEVMRVVRDEKIAIAEKQSFKSFLSESHIKKICNALVAGFQTKKIPLKETESNKKKLSDAKSLELYCLGLLNNWLRRDNRLNGTLDTKIKTIV